jgi:hypothetical protein
MPLSQLTQLRKPRESFQSMHIYYLEADQIKTGDFSAKEVVISTAIHIFPNIFHSYYNQYQMANKVR